MNRKIFNNFEDQYKDANISGKISYTNMLECIPENSLKAPIPDWQQSKILNGDGVFCKFQNWLSKLAI